MFTDKHVRMHVQKAVIKTEERKKDERFPVLAVALVLEPLTLHLAKQLGPDVAAHCFTPTKKIRDEMTKIEIRLREKEQALTVCMADVAPHCVLRQVRLTGLTIAKRVENDQVERKSKKVAPQGATLRLTLNCLIDPAERVHRDFFCSFIGSTFAFTFDPEERDLFVDVHTDEDDDDDGDGEEQRELEGHAPPANPDAGDVLDEPTPKDKKKPGRPKLVKKHTNGSGKSAEA